MDGSGFYKRGELQQEACAVQKQKYSIGSGVSGKQSRAKWTGKQYFPTQVPSLWIKVNVGICVMLTVDKANLISVTEYLWISTMWNTLQKRHQL